MQTFQFFKNVNSSLILKYDISEIVSLVETIEQSREKFKEQTDICKTQREIDKKRSVLILYVVWFLFDF